MFSLNFSSKFPWCSPVTLKFESLHHWVFQHCKMNCHKLTLWVFSEQLLCHIIFEWLHCYEVTLLKKYKSHCYKKVKQRFSTKSEFIKNLFKAKITKIGRFKSLMFAVELLENSAVVCIVTLCFQHAQHFHVSYHLRYYMIIDHC